jgi:hypothetical protein
MHINTEFSKPGWSKDFAPGALDYSVAYHAQGQVCLVQAWDSLSGLKQNQAGKIGLCCSQSMAKPGVQAAIACSQQAEAFMNALVYFTNPTQYWASVDTCHKLATGKHQPKVIGDGILQSVKSWPSIFTGFTWVINHVTPCHHDTSGFHQGYDYLAVNGSATADLELSDLGLYAHYQAGDVVAFTGWILAHSVSWWPNGDRVCSVRWIRQSVMDKVLGISKIEYPLVDSVAERLGVS